MNVLNLRMQKPTSPLALINKALARVPNYTDRCIATARLLLVADARGKGCRVADTVAQTVCGELVAQKLLRQSGIDFFAFADSAIAKNIAANHECGREGFVEEKKRTH